MYSKIYLCINPMVIRLPRYKIKFFDLVSLRVDKKFCLANCFAFCGELCACY